MKKAMILFLLLACLAIAGTAKAENTINKTPELKITVALENETYTGTQHTSLFRIDNLNYSGQALNITVAYNITGPEFLFTSSFTIIDLKTYRTAGTGFFSPGTQGQYQICGKIIGYNASACKNITAIDIKSVSCSIELSIETNSDIFENKIEFRPKPSTEEFPYIIEYWVEDLFGNIIKQPLNTTNSNQKSFTPRVDFPSQAFMLKARLAYAACNNTENASAEKIVGVKGNEKPKNSSIEISELYLGSTGTASIGSTFRARLSIYRGETLKTAISIWAEDIQGQRISTEVYRISANNRFSETEITIPITLRDFCAQNISSQISQYFLVAEGLDAKANQSFQARADLCQSQQASSAQSASQSAVSTEQTQPVITGFNYEMLSMPAEIRNNEEFFSEVLISSGRATNFTIWSYVYRGSRCYSGEREENKQHAFVDANSNVTVTLANTAVAPPGDYLFKVKILQEGLRTEREITESITVIESKQQEEPDSGIESHDSLEPQQTAEKTQPAAQSANIYQHLELETAKESGHENPESGETIYLSTSEKAKHYAKYMLIGISILINIILIARKKLF